ncbi:MAG: glycosyltransferase [Gammaproteobacteria bacterium]|nr:glycosyltransferase [Gammaproteobacteria bacterium]
MSETQYSGNISRAIILSTCYTPSPPSNYGGIEQIAFLTAKELASRGIESWLFGSNESPEPESLGADYNLIKVMPTGHSEHSMYDVIRDSIFDGGLVTIDDNTVIIDHTHEKWAYLYKRDHPEINLMSVVHDANPFGTPPPIGKPCMIGISEKLSAHLSHTLGIHVETAYNGVDIDQYAPKDILTEGSLSEASNEVCEAKPESDSGYILFVSRIVREKGPHEAIFISEQTGIPLIIAGTDSPVFCEQSYVHNIITKCDGNHIKYLGEVSHEKKVELMQNAAMTVLPVSFNEPFGLVAVESMLCGTPVIALDMGAYKETVTAGGYVCDTVGEMVKRARTVDELDKDRIVWNGKQFSAERMCDRYIELMEMCISNPW